VVRIRTAGGDDGEGDEDEDGKEFLYYVAGDGAVNVFERGT
jgi:streptomycin 6-kinase